MTPERFALLQRRLAARQPDLTVLMDRLHKPHNFAAVLRSADAVGVHRVHLVPAEGGYALPRSAAQGTQKWVRVERHRDVEAATALLRGDGFHLVAAHLARDAVDFREVDYRRPTALILGAEKYGVSEAALARCETRVRIPMQGMVESLNVSVAAALLLFEAQRQRLAAGAYDQRRLDDREFRTTLFEWAHPRIARYCRDKGLAYPPLDDHGQITGRLKGMASDPWDS